MNEAEILALESGIGTDARVSTRIGYRLFRPTEHITTAFELEEIVKLDGNIDAYRTELKTIVQEDDDENLHFWWLLAHATPLQRCKAYLMLYAT